MKLYDLPALRAQAQGRWLELIPYVAPGMFDEALDNLGRHVTCPLHGGVNDFRFIKVGSKGRGNTAQDGSAICTCCFFSNGFNLLQKATGKSFYQVVVEVDEYLNGVKSVKQPPPYIPPPRAETPEEIAENNRRILWRVCKLWSAGRVAPLAEVPYYVRRGIAPYVLEDVMDVRIMASLGYYSYVNREIVKTGSYPALLALLRSAQGEPVAVHRTWLSQDRTEKAPVPSAKKLTESPGVGGAAVRLFDATGSKVLGLTEGVETALAVRQMSLEGAWPAHGVVPVWACFSERTLRNFEVPDFLKNSLEKIVIFADNDENNKGWEAAQALKARLAIEQPHLEVVIEMPDVVGWDWLDALVNQDITA